MTSLSLFAQATKLYHSGDVTAPDCPEFDDVLELLAKSIEADENPARAYNLRWHIHYLRRDYAAAARDLDQAIAIEPGTRHAYYNRGVLRHHLGDYERALSDFYTAVKLAKASGDDDLVDAVEHHIYEIKAT
jgi:tetratricopeptide (TPR) repeat protein